MQAFRWLLSVPLGFLASILAGALANWLATFLGSSAFYAWGASGAFSALAFFGVSQIVAPYPAKGLNWVVAIVVALFGLASLAGALMGDDSARAFAGLAMVLVAWHLGRKPMVFVSRAAKAPRNRTEMALEASQPPQ